MPLVAVLDDSWSDGKRIHVVGHLVNSGVYPAANGEPLDLSPCTVGNGAQLAPIPGTFMVAMPAGYSAYYVDPVAPGAGMPGAVSAGKLKMYSAAATELANAAYPAGLIGVSIGFRAVFYRGSGRG